MSWQEDLVSQFNLDRQVIASLELLLKMLHEKADRSLTAVTSSAKIIDFHFRDSLSLLALPEVASARELVDVGSGAGFPGLPLAICSPEMKITLIESNHRKSDFIIDFIKRSGLQNVTVETTRAEMAGRRALRDHFDVGLARAVGPLSLTMEYTGPLVRSGGSLILQRGETLGNEESTAVAVAGILNLSLGRIEPYQPYIGARNLHFWVFWKLDSTPAVFPRKPGIAKKRPLP